MNAIVKISRSSVIDHPVDDIWRLLRDFNGHSGWHPAIAESHMEAGEPGDVVGGIRNFRLADGSMLREQLIALSDRDRELTYCLIDAPLPLADYVATMRLRPVTEGGRTFIQWQSRFRPPKEEAAALSRLVAENIYEAGFAALKARFEGQAAPAARPAPRPAQATVEIAPPREAAAPRPGAQMEESAAIVVDHYGGPEVLTPRTVRVPPPGSGEARIRHAAIGVNFIDVYCRTGYFNLLTPPGVPGMEAAGTVLDVGPDVTHVRSGDRVVYACEPVGAYAATRTMPAALLVPLPSDIAEETAAAVFLKGLSAEFLLHDVYPVSSRDTVLVHAAAGGMGLLLCQWASAIGARVIGTVSSEVKAARAHAAGCEYPIVYTRQDFVEEVGRITGGRGADVVYDGVGADTFGQSLEALAARGHLVSFGQASGSVGSWDIGAMAGKSITVSRPNFGHYTTNPEELRARAARLFDALRRGVIAPAIDRRFPLAEAAEAHRRLEHRENIGAIVLLP
jgi:NADPH:quinone reductase-like Zn-dependent oxidoreductase